MRFRFGQFALHKVGFAKMRMSAAMPGISNECLLIVLYGRVELS